MKKLSERIKALRMPGETQADFAHRLGTTQASISRYINGRQPDRETLVKIAKKTGTSLDWLLTGQGPAPGEGPKAKGKGDDELVQNAIAYLGDLSDVPARDKNRIADMLRDLTADKELRKEVLAAWEKAKK